MKNNSIMLIIDNYTLKKRTTRVNILQNSLSFSILYLFYNANLLKTCKDVRLRLSFINFINSINILIYNEFTE